jgi:hypothetical protein
MVVVWGGGGVRRMLDWECIYKVLGELRCFDACCVFQLLTVNEGCEVSTELSDNRELFRP